MIDFHAAVLRPTFLNVKCHLSLVALRLIALLPTYVLHQRRPLTPLVIWAMGRLYRSED